MKSILRPVTAIAMAIAATTGVTQEHQIPAGNWQSASTATFTNPALTGAELYLNINVAKDGSFQGVWSQYFCTPYPGAHGVSLYSCNGVGTRSYGVSGRFNNSREGVIELEQLGRSAFTWSAPDGDQLALDLPENWQGGDAILHRARLTRDGKGKPANATGPTRDKGAPTSAVALYREFNKDYQAALRRYRGQTLVLEGRRGALIELSDGGAAIHISDGFTSRALVLYFPELAEVSGIGEDAEFRFRCTVADFDYQYVQLKNCSVVH